jgi:hypothetical protein
VCRPAAGPCDVAETCTGSSAQCPPDAFVPAGTVCRAGNMCNPAEVCTGASAACPADTGTLPNGTPCLNAATRQCCNGMCCPANRPRCVGGACVP